MKPVRCASAGDLPSLVNIDIWEREPAEMGSSVGTDLPSPIDRFGEGRRRDRD